MKLLSFFCCSPIYSYDLNVFCNEDGEFVNNQLMKELKLHLSREDLSLEKGVLLSGNKYFAICLYKGIDAMIDDTGTGLLDLDYSSFDEEDTKELVKSLEKVSKAIESEGSDLLKEEWKKMKLSTPSHRCFIAN